MGGLNLQNRTGGTPSRRGLGPVDLGDFVQEAVGMGMGMML
jgi:hypothetical protein